ncbi:MAG: hypothetical protein ACI3VY_02005 [Faecousia sp.]
MRLIDADFFNNFDYSCFDGRLSEDAIQGMNTVLDVIDNAPTIDAEPVVRCKYCKHSKPDIFLEDHITCPFRQTVMPCLGFCSYGERKDAVSE